MTNSIWIVAVTKWIFIHRNAEGTEEKAVNFHRIFAYDPELCEYIQKNLQRRDHVMVTGKIAQKTHTEPDGSEIHYGYILANSIHKMKKHSRDTD